MLVRLIAPQSGRVFGRIGRLCALKKKRILSGLEMSDGLRLKPSVLRVEVLWSPGYIDHQPINFLYGLPTPIRAGTSDANKRPYGSGNGQCF